MSQLLVSIPPRCSSTSVAALNSSIPFALLKSTVVMDQARLCTSTSKHRQSMYNVWLCSMNPENKQYACRGLN